MANKDDVMHGPYTFDLNIYMSNGANVAVAKCSLPVGRLPTQESVNSLLEEAQKSAKQQSPDFVLMGRNEFENTLLAERTGGLTGNQTFATKEEWDWPDAEDTGKLNEALRWCSASADFQVGGQARDGWLKVVAPLLYTEQEVASLRAMDSTK